MDRVLDGRPPRHDVIGFTRRREDRTAQPAALDGGEKGFHTAKVEAPEGGMLPQLLAPELRQVLYSLDIRLERGTRSGELLRF